MIVLGINAYHGDASAALLVDGNVVAALEEERLSRQKHQAGFPALAIQWCLDAGGVRPEDVDHVAVSRNPAAHLAEKARWTMTHRPSGTSLRRRTANTRQILGARRAFAESLGIDESKLKARHHRVEHHRAHLASAMFCSPFREAACISLDGMGDFMSSMWGRGLDNRITIQGSVAFPHSLGIFYTAFTQFLGLPAYGDEYKLMGLSAYGQPTYVEALRQVLRLGSGMDFALQLDWFCHHDKGVDMTWAEGTPQLGPLYGDAMVEAFGPPREFRSEVTQRDRDLAASVQLRLEEVELELLRRLHERVGSPRLVLAGGVALNCVVNGRIREETPFQDVWIQPAANDAGTAVGAALWVWNQVLGQPRVWEMSNTYLGPAFDNEACLEALLNEGLAAKTFGDDELVDYVAGRIAEGAITGWYQGRAEFGPRALGNRSIVCDPRRPDMKDVLNARIKHREPFRPFAPSILAEATGEWFEQDYPSPYMLMAYRVRPERRNQIPAVTHEDGTGRLQTVHQADNPRYHSLISAFYRRTGVPVLLNTSFNENEPIVTHPEEAVRCFVRTDMDLLALGNYVVDRGTSH